MNHIRMNYIRMITIVGFSSLDGMKEKIIILIRKSLNALSIL